MVLPQPLDCAFTVCRVPAFYNEIKGAAARITRKAFPNVFCDVVIARGRIRIGMNKAKVAAFIVQLVAAQRAVRDLLIDVRDGNAVRGCCRISAKLADTRASIHGNVRVKERASVVGRVFQVYSRSRNRNASLCQAARFHIVATSRAARVRRLFNGGAGDVGKFTNDEPRQFAAANGCIEPATGNAEDKGSLFGCVRCGRRQNPCSFIWKKKSPHSSGYGGGSRRCGTHCPLNLFRPTLCQRGSDHSRAGGCIMRCFTCGLRAQNLNPSDLSVVLKKSSRSGTSALLSRSRCRRRCYRRD